MIGYGITLKVSKSKYKNPLLFYGKHFKFPVFVYKCFKLSLFSTDCSTFCKQKSWKNLKNVKIAFLYKKIKKNVYKPLLQLWLSTFTVYSCARGFTDGGNDGDGIEQGSGEVPARCAALVATAVEAFVVCRKEHLASQVVQ